MQLHLLSVRVFENLMDDLLRMKLQLWPELFVELMEVPSIMNIIKNDERDMIPKNKVSMEMFKKIINWGENDGAKKQKDKISFLGFNGCDENTSHDNYMKKLRPFSFSIFR